MNSKLIASAVSALLSFNCAASGGADTEPSSNRVAQCFGNVFEAYVRTKLNRLPNPILKVEGARPLESIFNDLDLSGFTYEDKREFCFMVAISIPRLDAADADTFRYCLRPDAARIAGELLTVSDAMLARYVFFSKDRIHSYRYLLRSDRSEQ